MISQKPPQEAEVLQPWEEWGALPLAQTFHLWYTHLVKLIAQLKLQPTSEQADSLLRTLQTANASCDYISRIAWESNTFSTFALQMLCYDAVRQTFGLAAQMTIRVLAKVDAAYKLDKKVMPTFKPHGAIAYDDRILSFNLKGSSVSIWTLNGRQSIPFVCGQRQRTLLQTQKGETDLVYVCGEWYLLAVCDVEEPEPIDVEGVLGIDLGVTNIATDSDGTIHQGKPLKTIRYRHRSLRTKLQKKRTQGSRRRLRRLSGHERRFATWVNHTLSKRIVATAKRTKRANALENLKDIRTRVRAQRSQRATLHSWGFFQLRAFIAYKAALAGVPVHFVDPRNTSRTYPHCGCIDKANRKTQASFICTCCGFAGLADVIAAGNIARRAVVNQPYYPDTDQSVAPG